MVPGWQFPSTSQHPLQFDGSQTQLPASHTEPPRHAGRPPQTQAPPGPQPLAVVGSQATQPLPPAPQLATLVEASQVPLRQQVLQMFGLQVEHKPASHTPAPQLAQAPPLRPHAAPASPGVHTSPAQHPPEQLFAFAVDVGQVVVGELRPLLLCLALHLLPVSGHCVPVHLVLPFR